MKQSSTKNRYAKLKKPRWSPPGWLFGPVRTFLYILIIISFGKVFMMGWGNEIPFIIVLPFILNLLFNIIFSPIQFRLQNNMLSAIDIILIRGTLIRLMIVIYPYLHRITYIQIPYLLRVSLATVLQLTITSMNRK
jgi:tryptophan-rich sensory protein